MSGVMSWRCIGHDIGARLAAARAFAQAKYPERPIRLVIPFPPGGVYDAVGRPWADRMKALLGTVVIENQGGAGGSSAQRPSLARSPMATRSCSAESGRW